MFSRLAALLIAALTLFPAVQAKAFDTTGYQADKVIEILVTGDATPILEADSAVRDRITFYAMSLASRLNTLWGDEMTTVFSDLAMVKAVEIGAKLGTSVEDQNALLSLGTEDANIFAARHEFDSEAARNMLVSLGMLILY
jgi:hypothetical protein